MFNIDQEKAKEITTGFQIPVKPEVLIELQQEQAKENQNINAIAEVIAKDVALSANILKTINSPIFGLNRTITDIKQSVIMLGIDSVSNIASFFQLKNASKPGDKKAAISHEKYWDTAMQTANMVGILIEQLNLKNNCPFEDAYALGLFRDCGIPLMAMKFPDYKEILIEANTHPQQEFTIIEESHYQTNHAVVGYFVARSWNFPQNICELILRHHEPRYLEDSSVTPQQKDLYALIKIASNALSQYIYMKDDTEWYLAKESVLGYLGLSEPDYQDIEDDSKETFRTQFG